MSICPPVKLPLSTFILLNNEAPHTILMGVGATVILTIYITDLVCGCLHAGQASILLIIFAITVALNKPLPWLPGKYGQYSENRMAGPPAKGVHEVRRAVHVPNTADRPETGVKQGGGQG